MPASIDRSPAYLEYLAKIAILDRCRSEKDAECVQMCPRVYPFLASWKVGSVGHAAVIEWLKTFYHNIVVNFRSELRKNFLTPKAVSGPGDWLFV